MICHSIEEEGEAGAAEAEEGGDQASKRRTS